MKKMLTRKTKQQSQTSKKKTVYVRYYDQENLGDDLFLQILTDRYMDRFSIRKSYTSGSFMPSNSIVTVRENGAVSLLDRVLSRVCGSRFILSLPAIRKHDLMVHIGGSLFMDTSGLSLWQREKHFYSQIKIPYYILGSNVGPVRTSQFIGVLKDIFRNAEDVCFRDQASFSMFRDISKTRVASDIAFTLESKRYHVVEGKTAIFSIIDGMKKFNQEMSDRYEQEIINLIQQLSMNDYRIVLMSFCRYEGDEAAINRVLHKMDMNLRATVDTYHYRGNLEEALTVLAESEIIIASRFHATILGLLFNKKVLPMAYSDKTTNILKDMDFKGPIVDINKIDSFHGSTFDFNSLKINNVDKQVQLAELQFQELDKVLTKRHGDV